MKGKNFGNRKPELERPLNDFYQTPKCMTWELLKTGYLDSHNIKKILDPCYGEYAITKELSKHNFIVSGTDLIYGQDFLSEDYPSMWTDDVDAVVMNPPFKLFNQFVEKAKGVATIICSIGKLNYFGAHDRNIKGLWEHLEWVLPFDRQIAFDKPFREDGKVECGMMVTGWFIWNRNYNGEPKIKVIDMQKYILKKGE